MGQQTGELVRRVGGVSFQISGTAGAVAEIIEAAKVGAPVSFHFANAYSVATAAEDREYAGVLNQGLTFADGVPVALILGRRLRRSTRDVLARGPSVFEKVLTEVPIRSYFLGSTEATLSSIRRRLKGAEGASEIAGTHAPPFGDVTPEQVAAWAALINETNAELVWVGMGSPKQDHVAAMLAPLVRRPCVAVGAAFDFFGKTVEEAPDWLRGTGFEWVFRLSKEPRRLWRRYTIGNLRFFRAVMGRS